MPTNMIDATDDIKSLFWVAWQANAPALNNSAVPKVFWDGEIELDNRPMDAPWASVVVRHQDAPQSSLSGETGKKRYTRFGTVFVQVFVPLTLDQRLSLAQSLAIIVEDSYKGKSTTSGVWFRNVRTNEVGPTEAWYQTNIMANFEYDEFR